MRFGNWKTALSKAGIQLSEPRIYTKEELEKILLKLYDEYKRKLSIEYAGLRNYQQLTHI